MSDANNHRRNVGLGSSQAHVVTPKLNSRMSNILTPLEAAAYLRFAPRTLANWRSAGVGPAYRTVRRRIRYRLDDLDRWLATNGVAVKTSRH